VVSLARRLALFAPLGLAVVLTNYFVDPGNFFGTDARETRMARELLAGRTVETSFDFDEVALQKRLALGRRRAPDVLVLGSSHAMMLFAKAFPDREVTNASVSAASLEDLIGLFELYEERGLRPKVLFLSIDVWALNGALRNPSRSLEPELQAGLRRLGQKGSLEGGRGTQWLLLASPAYFQTSLFQLAASAARLSQTGHRNTIHAPKSVRHPDGSVEWTPLLADRTPEEVEAIATRGVAPSYVRQPPDPERVRLLGAFLDDLGRRGCRVILWLPPYHPAAYPSFSAAEGAGLPRSEAKIRALALTRGIPVLGSYDPSQSPVVGADFIDDSHMRRRPANALVARQMAEAGTDLDAPKPFPEVTR